MRGRRRLPAGLVLLLVAGCAGAPPPAAPVPEVEEPAVEHDLRPVPSEAERTLSRGLVAANEGDYRAARRALTRVAGSCPGTPPGVEALVALLSVELDPRNPDRDPLAARQLAEAFLSLPVKPAWTAPAVETLYLMALDVADAAVAASEVHADTAPGDTVPGVDTTSTDGGAPVTRPGPADARDDRGADPVADEGPMEAGRTGENPTGEERGAAGPTDNGHRTDEAAAVPEAPILSCDVTGPPLSVGPTEAPVRLGPSAGDRLRNIASQRDSLASAVARLERELRELRQELERIRETLKP